VIFVKTKPAMICGFEIFGSRFSLRQPRRNANRLP